MPLYLDRHDVAGATREETARAHAADLEIAGAYGVEFLTYWHNPALHHVFCLLERRGRRRSPKSTMRPTG
jgi:hypothetical protein